jgi:ribosomal protein L28
VNVQDNRFIGKHLFDRGHEKRRFVVNVEQVRIREEADGVVKMVEVWVNGDCLKSPIGKLRYFFGD